jgi:hypothetical protein
VEIEFYGKYDKAEFFQAVALVNKPSGRGAIIRYGLAAVFLVIFITYFVTVAAKESLSTFEVARIGRLLISVGIAVYILLQPRIAAYQTATRLWKTPTVQGPLGGFVSSQGVTYVLADGRAERFWHQFARVRKTDKFIALLTSDGVLFLLPRSFFKSEHDWNTVQQWAGFKVFEAV